MFVQSFLDPGHGLLSSVDERTVAVSAFVFLTLVARLAEAVDGSRAAPVLAGLVAFVAGVVALAPPVYADEWHYAVLAALPVVVAVYRDRLRAGVDPVPDAAETVR